MEPEDSRPRRLRGVDLPEIGAEDDHDVRDVGMMAGPEGLLRCHDPLHDRLPGLRVFERVQLAAKLLDEGVHLVRLDAAVRLPAL